MKEMTETNDNFFKHQWLGKNISAEKRRMTGKKNISLWWIPSLIERVKMCSGRRMLGYGFYNISNGRFALSRMRKEGSWIEHFPKELGKLVRL